MKRLIAFAASAAILAGCARENVVNVHEVAVTVSEKGLSRTDLGHYMGTCLYHGMADLALASGEKSDMDRVMNIMGKIASGEIPITYGAFIDYEIGGQAAALLAYSGQTGLVESVKACAAKMWKEQARTSDNMMTRAKEASLDCYWIDIAFTVTPFFLYSGLLENNQEYLDYSAFYAMKMCKDLYDPESGLFHQGRNHPHCNPGVSEDCWSRGNGWMSMALGTLLRDYPRDGKYWNEIVETSAKFYESALKYMDETGCWHQEMTDLSSYVEVSGSAQILAGLGAAIEAGILDSGTYMPYFKKGLKGILGWVDPDGSVGHTCRGNCVPGKGRKEDFTPIHFYYNENHSFGPVVLALAQALKLGIKEIALDAPMGSSNDADRPRAYARLITERKNDVAWENDRVAFRVYSQIASKKPVSGVDFWPKTVDYSIIDEWYAKDANGGSYHVDNGTGCDWYNMGPGRGIGGSGIWDGSALACAIPYKTVEIASQGPERLDFTLTYDPYDAAGDTITETKRIEMVCGTSFFKVTETVTTASGRPVTLAVGAQIFGNPEIITSEGGKVFVWEEHKFDRRVGIGCDSGIEKFEGGMGTAVIVNPAQAAGTVQTDTDILQLVTVNSGEPVVYYVGAKWGYQQDSGRWSERKPFWVRSAEKETWEGLNSIYE